ncbi:MAG: cytochrome c [Paraglaciecola sp.]|uniref:c-type cytochrome n=1 Tax=Paraglaciecola sp. TaxID=1920173 RepID=UPI00273D707A|nr:cytochrome c [Paraglaciecola sp.]MDP5029125.1 cytochrome c [Paraglaciecola sp.]MDP5040053.1 cytochrome c [Paraglaciecola sp.]MDP5129422.1 cytochrome c [Paraglaciecola sp.]
MKTTCRSFSTFKALAISSAVILSLHVSVNANATDASSTIETRQQNFKEMGKAMKTINQQLKSGAPDLSVIQQHAGVLADHAQVLPDWFPAGTGQETGLDTDALAEIWSQADKFADKAEGFKQSSQALLNTAEKGDIAALMGGLVGVKDSCSACHKSFRAD